LYALKRNASYVALALPARAQSHSDSSDDDARLAHDELAHERDVGMPLATRCDSGDEDAEAVVEAGSETLASDLAAADAAALDEGAASRDCW
jgi:hypothetical protein